MASTSAVMTLLAKCLMNRRRNAAASEDRETSKGRKGELLVSSAGSQIRPLLISQHTKITTTQVTQSDMLR